MRYFIFSLMLAAAAHAITCTEGYFLFLKDKGSFYLNEGDAIIDQFYEEYNDSDDFISQKFIREPGQIKNVHESSTKGVSTSDTTIIHLINDINSPADGSIAYKKTLVGDTTVIELIDTEQPDPENDTRVIQVLMKIFKNGVITEYTEVSWGGEKSHEEGFLKNDTLVSYRITPSNDSVNYTIIVNDKDDNKTCREFTKMQADPGSNDREIIENTDRIYKVEETDTGFVIKKIRETRIDQYTLVYTDGRATTSIAKRPAARLKQPSRDYYFDTKGRKQLKAIPYRVQF